MLRCGFSQKWSNFGYVYKHHYYQPPNTYSQHSFIHAISPFHLIFQEFVKDMRMRPLNRHYFVLQTNPGEQFYLFTSLAAWLVRKTGRDLEPPNEYDDPNSTIANILDHVRQMGVSIDFPPSKLKQGFGEQAIYVLDRLSGLYYIIAYLHVR